MKGTELIKTIREMDHDIVVVMIKENSKLDTSFDFVSSGADGCLVKPILAKDLLDMVDELIH